MTGHVRHPLSHTRQRVLIDMEASPPSKGDAVKMLKAMSASSLVQLIRVPAIDRHLIGHALDVGTHVVVVPKVEAREQAAVAAVLASVDVQTICAVQAETWEGIDHIDEIAEVQGVDIVLIGVGDLACSLGQPGGPYGPVIDADRQRVLAATRAAGKRPGIFVYSNQLAYTSAEEGFELIAVGNEMKLFMSGCQETMSAFRASGGL